MCNSFSSFRSGSDSGKLKSDSIYLANGNTLKIHSIGDVELKLNVKESRPLPVILKGVLMVPELTRNLFSVTACMKQGINVLFDCPDGQCYLKKNGEIVGIASLKKGLWVLQTAPMTILETTPKANVAFAISATTEKPNPIPESNEEGAGWDSTYLVYLAPPMAAVSVRQTERCSTRPAVIGPRPRPRQAGRYAKNEWTYYSPKNLVSAGSVATRPATKKTSVRISDKPMNEKKHVGTPNPFSVLAHISSTGDDLE